MVNTLRIGVLAFAMAISSPASSQAQNCGGVERWAVKVGGDSGAASIVTSSPIQTPLHTLVTIPRPANLPTDDVTRAPEERQVRTVAARLLKFKLESGRTGDQDYHLVMTDDTLLFSPGGSGTQASPHSFVAEIVNPACVGGRHGNSPTPSAFAAQLAAVFAKFESHFAEISGGWNDAEGIPVTVTGLVFFDRPHGQTGRAPNGVEIHPVLDIDFSPLTPAVPPLPTATLIQNGGFESGTTGWSSSANVITTDNREPAHSGIRKAWLGGYGETHTDRLSQQVTLPAIASGISLQFQLHISTAEESLQAFDRLRVRVRDANGQLLTTLKVYSNLQAAPGFALQTLSLTQFKGRTIRIELVSEEDNGSETSFVVDDFVIIIEQ